jgi:hypothetical protein
LDLDTVLSLLVDAVFVVSNSLDLGAEFYGVILALGVLVSSASNGTFSGELVRASTSDGSLFH